VIKFGKNQKLASQNQSPSTMLWPN